MREDPATHFGAWVATHAKSYVADVEEMAHRLVIWTENLDYVISYNQKQTSHWLGMNSMADLTHDEYHKYLGYKPSSKNQALQLKAKSNFKYADYDKNKLPPAVDWRASGAVTPGNNLRILLGLDAIMTLISLLPLSLSQKPSTVRLLLGLFHHGQC